MPFMQRLEFKLTVPGHALLDDNVREFLQSEEAFAPLPHSLRGPVSDHGVPHGLFSVRVEQSRVFISNDWVVSIHARKLIQCVSAMAILLSTIGRRSDGAVEVSFLLPRKARKRPWNAHCKWRNGKRALSGSVDGQVPYWQALHWAPLFNGWLAGGRCHDTAYCQ